MTGMQTGNIRHYICSFWQLLVISPAVSFKYEMAGFEFKIIHHAQLFNQTSQFTQHYLCGHANTKLRLVRINVETRMHSSRMRTACCNGRFSCHATPCHTCPRHIIPCHTPRHAHPLPHMAPPCTPPKPHMPYCHACPPPDKHAPSPCMPPAMHTPWNAYPHHTCPPTMHVPCEQNHRHLWKHNLAATSFRR